MTSNSFLKRERRSDRFLPLFPSWLLCCLLMILKYDGGSILPIEYRSLYYPANSARDLNISLFAINLLWKPQLPPISQPDKLMCCHFISAFCFFKCSQSFCWCQSASILGKFKFWLLQWLGRAGHADVVELSFSGGAATIRSHYPAVAPSRLQSPS